MRSAIEKLREAMAETGSNSAATAAMANLAEAIHGLVSHMRTEQQMIRDWADAQAAQSREIAAACSSASQAMSREGRSAQDREK